MKFLIQAFLLTSLLGLTACFQSDSENVAEDVGEQISETAEEAGEQISETAEDVEESMKDTADDIDDSL